VNGGRANRTPIAMMQTQYNNPYIIPPLLFILLTFVLGFGFTLLCFSCSFYFPFPSVFDLNSCFCFPFCLISVFFSFFYRSFLFLFSFLRRKEREQETKKKTKRKIQKLIFEDAKST
jgi:hypothetical protein